MMTAKSGSISLRLLLVAGAFACGVVPVITLAVGSALEMKNLVISEAMRRAERNAGSLAEDVRLFIDESKDAIEVAASYAKEFEVARPDSIPISNVLSTTRKHYPKLDRVNYVDPSGNLVVSDPPLAEGSSTTVNYADREWYRQVIATRKTFVDPNIILARVLRQYSVV